MGLKGTTTIQLFDSKTNELVQEVYEENMITNGVSNFLNPHPNNMENGSQSTILLNALPFRDKMFGGIMVWSENLPENVNTLEADPNNCIGWAGSAYSGSIRWRGSYNTNESGSITNGYRNVWDFGTDKANGSIKCLSLTTKTGGDTGFYPESENISTYWDITKYNAMIGEPIVQLNNGMYCTHETSSSNLIIRYYQCFDANNISILRTKEDCVLSNTLTIPLRYTPNIYGKPVYDSGILSFVYLNNSNKTQCEIVKVNLSLKTYTKSSLTLNLTGYAIVSTQGCSFIKDYIYASVYKNSQYYIAQINMSGSVVSEKLPPTQTVYDIILIHDRIWLQYSNYYYLYNNYNRRLFLANQRICYSDITSLPYIVTKYSGDNNFRLGFFAPTIMSINNLATAVVKTSGQTMKITYDLTETPN